MRSMWKGAVSFGLVMIPVKLYAATETRDIAFRQVHREDGGRIRFRRFCTIDEQEVPYEDIAKGYELPDGEMVVLTDDDMAELPLPTTRNIEVVQFCPAEQLDPILFNRSYYVEPEAAGTRAYTLLRDALEESGKIAIAQVALRQRESLAILRVREGVLVLETLLWPDEVRVPEFAFLDDHIDVRPQELQMAGSLIDSMTVDFDPAEYHDSYREAVQELVAAKTEGRAVFQPEPAETDTGAASSLADALRASLAAAKGGRLGAVPAVDEDDAEQQAPAKRRPAASSRSGSSRAKTAAGTSSARRSKASPAKADDGQKADQKQSGKGRTTRGGNGAKSRTASGRGAAATARSRSKSAAGGEEEKSAQRRSRRAS